jgi:hypothetical protein
MGVTRRKFLKNVAIFAAGLPVLKDVSWAQIKGKLDLKILPEDATWQHFLDANNAAFVDTIVLPNAPIDQRSAISLLRSVKIIGSGPLSKIRCGITPSIHGSGRGFEINYGNNSPQISVRLEGFSYEVHGTAGRFDAFVIAGPCDGVYIRNIAFKGIRGNCITENHTGTVGKVQNIYVEDCTVNEHYESFYLLIAGSVKNLNIIGNKTFSSAANPIGNVSRPSGVFIDYEYPGLNGLVEEVTIANNQFRAKLSGVFNFANSIGLAIRVNGKHDFRYHKINAHNNLFSGFDIGALLEHMQNSAGSTLFPGPSHNSVTNNEFRHCGNISVRLDPRGAVGDYLFFGDNKIFVDAPQKMVGAISRPRTSRNVTVVELPKNRIIKDY